MKINKKHLEKLYIKYNRREFVHPDPLELLYKYKNVCDREIAALIASSLAYGRVRQIIKSVSLVLNKMVPSPSLYLKKTGDTEIQKTFKNFKHRFTTGEEISSLLIGIKSAINKYGSLEKCFCAGLKDEHETILPALSSFSEELLKCSRLRPAPAGAGLRSNNKTGIIPLPDKGSACKRLNLFLRWMTRKDAVDPGGWTKIPTSKLIVPLDTHMHRISKQLGLTKRKQANLKTVLEITDAFRKIAPDDPVKYDFVLTRFGIHDELKRRPLWKVKCFAISASRLQKGLAAPSRACAGKIQMCPR